MSKKPTIDALEILNRRVYAGKSKRIQQREAARVNDDIARKLYDLRAKAGLTQGQLAKMVGTTPSVISRLESADYQGHSLTVLRRIAAALDLSVEVRFVPLKRSA
jgi:DNA-binding XRE family transcriptional regulator